MAWIVLAVFGVCAALMYRKVLSALVALPLMAVAIALIAMYSDPVGALGLVRSSAFDRIPGVAKLLKPDSLDDPALVDVEARDHAHRHQVTPPVASIHRLSSEWPQTPESSG